MALILPGGAALLATIGGFLQARESVFFFYVAHPFALGGVAAHVIAAGWPLRARPDRRRHRLWIGTTVARQYCAWLCGPGGRVGEHLLSLLWHAAQRIANWSGRSGHT